MHLLGAVSKGSLDIFHYWRTYYCGWFSSVFLMESKKYRENITCETASNQIKNEIEVSVIKVLIK